MDHQQIDDTAVAGEDQLRAWLERVGGAGYRGTATAAHEALIDWVEDEVRRLPEVTVRSDPYEVLRWQPVPEGDLVAAGHLAGPAGPIRVAGAVPYTRPTTVQAPLVAVPLDQPITATAAGKVVLRDFPPLPLPYEALLGLADHLTPGAEALHEQTWDRPGLADGLLHADLLAAGAAGAAGLIIAFDLPRAQMAGYFEPHKGTHHPLPGVFVGVDEREQLRTLAAQGAEVELAVQAQVGSATTRNLHATLPGQTDERIVLVTHTDGTTWVQENGIVALLALGQHLAGLPLEQRHRTVELAFTTAHLHISREGAARYGATLDREYDEGTVAFVFPMEHLGARNLEPVERPDGPGCQLEFTQGSEPVLWAVGPSEAMQEAVVAAVQGRGLERVLVAPGFGAAVEGRVPRIVSFGGLGTHFHVNLVPTTSIITGPWSLWAPSFGADAVDVATLRQQVLAAGDVVRTLDRVPREAIAGGYLDDRAARAAGAPVGVEPEPPEIAPKMHKGDT